MNTRLSLVLPSIAFEAGEKLTAEIGSRLVREERIMSRFDPDAELASVNRMPARQRLRLSNRLFGILSDCRAHWIRTNGAFDVTLGAVNDNWRSGFTKAALGGWECIDLDVDDCTIAFAQAGVQIDLGGIGKGIALKGVARQIEDAGVVDAFVSFGDSSILAIGSQPSDEPWRIGIRDHVEPATSLHTFELRGGSVSTSGVDPARPHIVDPRPRSAPSGRRTLSVACACPIEAEVLSTALIVRPAKDRATILANYPPVRAIEFSWRAGGGHTVAEKVWSHGL